MNLLCVKFQSFPTHIPLRARHTMEAAAVSRSDLDWEGNTVHLPHVVLHPVGVSISVVAHRAAELALVFRLHFPAFLTVCRVVLTVMRVQLFQGGV